jgi:hypothetical protein
MSRNADKITPADIEAKLRNLKGGATERAKEAQATAVQIGIGIGLVVLIIAFLLGQRRGKRKTTFVEIRRF